MKRLKILFVAIVAIIGLSLVQGLMMGKSLINKVAARDDGGSSGHGGDSPT